MAKKAAIIRALELLDTDSDALAHYGVVGMRWGVRRSRRTGRGGRDLSDKKAVEVGNLTDHQRAMILKARGTKNLTTAELKELTTRLQLEKQLAQLKPATPYTKVNAFVNQFLSAGKTAETAYNLYNSKMVKDIIAKTQATAKRSSRVASKAAS